MSDRLFSEAGGNVLPSEDLLREITDPQRIEVAKDFYIGYLLVNKHRLGEAPAIVAPGGFLSDITTPDRAYEAAQLAKLDRPVLLVDMPGHGISTPHNRKQIYDLCIKRDASSSAAPLVDAVRRILPPEDSLDYFGLSHGGYLALKMTEADPADRVRTVFGIDIPATQRTLTLGLQVGYVVMDNVIGRRQSLEELRGSKAQAAFEAFKERYAKADVPERAPSFMRNNPGLFALNSVASVNARPGALDAWREIMQNKTARVEVVTSDRGHVSSALAIEAFIAFLSEAEQKRSKQTVIEGDHNISMTQRVPGVVARAEVAYGFAA